MLFKITLLRLLLIVLSIIFVPTYAQGPVQADRMPGPLGEQYKKSKATTPGVVSITFYRPLIGDDSGAASLEVDGHLHTALSQGAYTRLCFMGRGAKKFEARMFVSGIEDKPSLNTTEYVRLKAGQDMYFRVLPEPNGRLRILEVSENVAQVELTHTREQRHIATRVADLVSCDMSRVETVKPSEITLATDVLFDFGRADIAATTRESRNWLDNLIKQSVKRYGSFENVRVEVLGYSDALGNTSSNQRLSEARAAAIKEYMTANGIPGSTITSEGRGEALLVAKNCARKVSQKSIVCNQANRRVNVTISVPVTAR
mgnify:CR=1 FL=1